MKMINSTNSQAAFEYALYMIASSYFKSARCKSGLQEKKLLLHYKETKPDTQYKMEDVCIRFMDDLVRRVPSKFFDRDVTVHLVGHEDAGVTELYFTNSKYVLRLKGIYKGGKTKIEPKVWRKNRPHKGGGNRTVAGGDCSGPFLLNYLT